MSTLYTDRLTLRRWRNEDIEPFRQMNADPKVMEFYPGVLTAAESDAIITRTDAHFAKHRFGLLAAELTETKEFLGFIGLQHVPFEAHFTPAVEIGWRIAFPYWNRGYATEGARALLTFGFRDLGLSEILALTYVGNHRSRRVMEKLGMTYDAKDDFQNPHPLLVDSWLKPHVVYRLKARAQQNA